MAPVSPCQELSWCLGRDLVLQFADPNISAADGTGQPARCHCEGRSLPKPGAKEQLVELPGCPNSRFTLHQSTSVSVLPHASRAAFRSSVCLKAQQNLLLSFPNPSAGLFCTGTAALLLCNSFPKTSPN